MAPAPEVVIKKLTHIFQETFPDISDADWLHATDSNIEGWDSFATFTLLTTAEQDFNIRIGLDKITEIHTYQDLLIYITNKLK